MMGLEDDPFLLGPGNFSGANELFNFVNVTLVGKLINKFPLVSWDSKVPPQSIRPH